MTDIADRSSRRRPGQRRTAGEPADPRRAGRLARVPPGARHITRVLEAELVADQQLSLAAYDVLVQLAEAPERRLRMTELADAVLLSRSGVTRLVDRLEKVRPGRPLPGWRPTAAAWPPSSPTPGWTGCGTPRAPTSTGVVRHFAARLGADDLDAMERISRRLIG